ncbi:CAAX prenyl protease [Colletotrichum tofieldiae]|uniref:intramembrane prenyl-peptidase Rce1 n=1 Tax=Colletotrichum tofieldiae TaxID=708197 RepID=A0A166MY44_9PEZI|nr:CAAX prenyl protease (CAAX amino terminal protease) [Colletotrichum tofieldiae]GKT53543.1 CAAX prenyl protease [Colletotrichum tofieldiae]GKT73296.1 CAAX prenyl protease [Colletotrichum tofieldiae]GKT88031.1 CAAX prenyl protease [Colletotrichum tofieldiae]
MSSASKFGFGPGAGPSDTQPAPLQPLTACAMLVVYTAIYVLPLYISPASRPSTTLSRDEPAVIRTRITSVLFSTTLCSALTYVILARLPDGALPFGPLHAMGYWPLGIVESTACLTLTATLFAAPLYETLLIDGVWEDWRTFDPIVRIWIQWTTWRNIVMETNVDLKGPLTEEMLFRSASVPLLLCARMSLTQTIFLSPVIFGLAHVHHFYEFRITHPKVPLVAAIARSVVQFAYTSLFGAYATFLFLRSGSLLAIVLVHAFCNAMGLPRFWGAVEPYWHAHGHYTQTDSRKWTFVYYVLLFVGAFSWWKGLVPLTESSMTLVPHGV